MQSMRSTPLPLKQVVSGSFHTRTHTHTLNTH
jgi:hypothetical protein